MTESDIRGNFAFAHDQLYSSVGYLKNSHWKQRLWRNGTLLVLFGASFEPLLDLCNRFMGGRFHHPFLRLRDSLFLPRLRWLGVDNCVLSQPDVFQPSSITLGSPSPLKVKTKSSPLYSSKETRTDFVSDNSRKLCFTFCRIRTLELL